MTRLAIVVALAACKQASHSPPAHELPPADRARAPGRACVKSVDCPSTAPGVACDYECHQGYCRLTVTADQVGAGPCFGEVEGTDSTFEEPAERTPVFEVCDSLAGLYCELSTHRCAAIKPIGAPCKSVAECGVGENCDFEHNVCAVPPKLGEACDGVNVRCGRDAYCDHERCASRHADGEPCSGDVACMSRRCEAPKGQDAEVCVPRVPRTRCPEPT